MFKVLCTSVALLVLFAVPSKAQNVTTNVRSVLQAADAAMGASKLNSVQYSGTGYSSPPGYSYSSSLDEPWPRYVLKTYVRTIDYTTMAMKEEVLRVPGVWPTFRGGYRSNAEWGVTQLVSGNHAWNLNDKNAPVPQPEQAELRQLEIMMTPHGFIRSALRAKDSTVAQQMEGAAKVNVVTFKAFGKYTINGWIGSDNLVIKTQTWVPDDVLGDMYVELDAGEYKDYDGIKFPTGLYQKVGVAPRSVLDISLANVKVNVDGAALAVPDVVRQASSVVEVSAKSRQLAPGIWLLSNATGNRNSLAIEFKTYIAVTEASEEKLAIAFINEAKRIIPGKPISYILNTHHHYDHSGGLRTFAAEGATVITHEVNSDFYEGVVFDLRPRVVHPDALSLRPRQVRYELVRDNFTLSDGDRTVVIHHMEGIEHSNDMLVAWLPKEKILFQADLFDVPPSGPPRETWASLLYNLRRLNLQPETIVSYHRGVYPVGTMTKAMGIEHIPGPNFVAPPR